MKHFRLFMYVLSFIGAATIAGAFYWVLPKTALVRVAGTEIKRQEGTTTHDVRYVQGEEISSGTPMVFRNEDTRWGLPPYFKFNAADISARASEIARDQPTATVLVTYYGIRNRMFDWYPNVIRLETVAADYTHLPIFNLVFLLVFWSVVIYVYVRIRRGFRRLSERLHKPKAPPVA